MVELKSLLKVSGPSPFFNIISLGHLFRDLHGNSPSSSPYKWPANLACYQLNTQMENQQKHFYVMTTFKT